MWEDAGGKIGGCQRPDSHLNGNQKCRDSNAPDQPRPWDLARRLIQWRSSSYSGIAVRDVLVTETSLRRCRTLRPDCTADLDRPVPSAICCRLAATRFSSAR